MIVDWIHHWCPKDLFLPKWFLQHEDPALNAEAALVNKILVLFRLRPEALNFNVIAEMQVWFILCYFVFDLA